MKIKAIMIYHLTLASMHIIGSIMVVKVQKIYTLMEGV